MSARSWFSPARSNPLPPVFRRLLAAAAATNVADGIRAAALPLLAVSLTRDPLLVAGLGVAQSLPGLLVGLPAGVAADRSDRRRVAVRADLAQSLLFALVVAAVVFQFTSIPLLYVIAFSLGVGETFGDTAMGTAVPALVADHQLEQANGRIVATVFAGQQLAGPAIGALLFAGAAAVVFGISAGLTIVSAALVASLPSLNRDTRPAGGAAVREAGLRSSLADRVADLRRDVRDGAVFLARDRTLGTLALLAVVLTLTDAAWFSVLVLLLTTELGAPAAAYGLVLAVAAVGGIAGGMSATRVLSRLPPAVVLRGGLVAVAGAQLAIGLAGDITVVTVGLVVGNVVLAWWFTQAATLRQALTPDRLLGRVGATWRTATIGAIPLGSWLGGVVAAGYGVRAPFVGGVPMLLVAAAVATRVRSTTIRAARSTAGDASGTP